MKDIFVGNLDYETSEDELRQLFAAYGPVDRVSIVTDRYSGQPHGFAFVEMASASDADKAITDEACLCSSSSGPQVDSVCVLRAGRHIIGASSCACWITNSASVDRTQFSLHHTAMPGNEGNGWEERDVWQRVSENRIQCPLGQQCERGREDRSGVTCSSFLKNSRRKRRGVGHGPLSLRKREGPHDEHRQIL
jgi:hypothetical protein